MVDCLIYNTERQEGAVKFASNKMQEKMLNTEYMYIVYSAGRVKVRVSNLQPTATFLNIICTVKTYIIFEALRYTAYHDFYMCYP
jgi:hypothetical protein